MRIVIQRVAEASVSVDNEVKSKIGKGLLVLLGIESIDGEEDIKWLVKKIINLRIFNDHNGIMNLSVKDISGEILLISQFTLFASTKKGNRPSYMKAAKPEIAIPIYHRFIEVLKETSALTIGTGVFGADMKVRLLNDGPTTIIIDSKIKE